ASHAAVLNARAYDPRHRFALAYSDLPLTQMLAQLGKVPEVGTRPLAKHPFINGDDLFRFRVPSIKLHCVPPGRHTQPNSGIFVRNKAFESKSKTLGKLIFVSQWQFYATVRVD